VGPDITAYPRFPPQVCGLPLASHYRLADQRIKDACGAAQARPGPQGPRSLTRAAGSHEMAAIRGNQP